MDGFERSAWTAIIIGIMAIFLVITLSIYMAYRFPPPIQQCIPVTTTPIIRGGE